MRNIYIKPFPNVNKQEYIDGDYAWSVSRLIYLSKNLKIMEVPLEHLSINYRYKNILLRDMVMHIKATLNADLKCPIILDEDGDVMDGRHRIMKAILKGKKTIKAVRFDVNPYPCRVIDNG